MAYFRSGSYNPITSSVFEGCFFIPLVFVHNTQSVAKKIEYGCLHRNLVQPNLHKLHETVTTTMTKSNQTVSVITQLLLLFTSSFKMSHLNNFQKSLIRTRLHEEVSIKMIALSLGSIKTDQDHQLIDFIRQNPDGNTVLLS
jgi:hypothetical protein